MTDHVPAAAKGLPKLTRRNLLAGLAAAPVAAMPTVALAAAPAENPALLAAHSCLLAAKADLVAADDALEWIAAEWRHVWPLAPEEILGGANCYTGPNAERDIIGNPVLRDKAELTIRLSRQFRREGGQTCFSVETPDELEHWLAQWQARQPRGRTAKALAGDRERRARMIEKLKAKLPLSRAYYAETKRLRDASGVKAVLSRRKIAAKAMIDAEGDIGSLPAFTMAGVAIKAATVKATYESMGAQHFSGILGDSYRLAVATLKALPAEG
jgi:hypothetical protein